MTLWKYGLYGGRWCDQEDPVLSSVTDLGHIPLPQYDPFFLHVSTRSCLSRSSFWKLWLLAVADPLQELSCSLISAFPPTELFILHTILMKWSGWECMREDIFVKPNDFKTDFRSWPHRQLHWKSWRSGTANVTGNGREEGNRNLKIDQGRTVPWWDHSLAVCLHCSYCNPVRGLMQSVLQTAPWQRWCWYPLSTHWREKACRRQVMLPNPHGREFAQQKVKASSLLLALCCCWLNSLSW